MSPKLQLDNNGGRHNGEMKGRTSQCRSPSARAARTEAKQMEMSRRVWRNHHIGSNQGSRWQFLFQRRGCSHRGRSALRRKRAGLRNLESFLLHQLKCELLCHEDVAYGHSTLRNNAQSAHTASV